MTLDQVAKLYEGGWQMAAAVLVNDDGKITLAYSGAVPQSLIHKALVHAAQTVTPVPTSETRQ